MNVDGTMRDALHARLRRPPSPSSVAASLPVLFFGDIFSARIATLGINPSWQEYLDPSGKELTGHARRFENLISLDAPTREALTDEQCERAINTMQGYFWPGKPVYQWFRSLERVMRSMGYSYANGEVVNLDLVQEATKPTWSELEKQFPNEASALMVADLPFLRWQLATFSLCAVVCNGKTPLRRLCGLLDEPIADVETIAQGHVGGETWYGTTGHIAGRALTILGWNIPLTRPSGLTTADKEELGGQLRQFLDDVGTNPDDAEA